MDLDKIFKLLDAGYTKEEIEKLTSGTSTETAEPEPEPSPAQSQDPGGAPDLDHALDGLLNKFESILDKKIQSVNVSNSRINEPPQQDASDILASIIAPPKKGSK